MMNYYTVLTTTGQAKLSAAIATGGTLAITQMALGDGGGGAVTPVENRSTLINEVDRGPLNSLNQDPLNDNWFTAERIILPNVGGWTIREVGLFDADGDLVAYGNFPESYKPMLTEGSGKELVVRMQFEVAAASTIILQVNPSIVLASQEWVLQMLDANSRAHRARRHYLNQV